METLRRWSECVCVCGRTRLARQSPILFFSVVEKDYFRFRRRVSEAVDHVAEHRYNEDIRQIACGHLNCAIFGLVTRLALHWRYTGGDSLART